MADLQRAVQALLDELVESGEEVGLQAAVYVEGQPAADCMAGWRSQDRETLVSEDTLFTTFSCTKGVVASAVHILAERGLIDYGRPVAEYWPAFAEAGKGSVSVAQALNHLAGIPQTVLVEGKSTAEIWADLDLCVAEAARLDPIFPPGSTVCYHGLTFGWIAEGIVRGLGLSLGEVVAEEIVKPLHMGNEMYLGTPASEHSRMATPFEKPPSGEPPEIDPLALRCVPPDIAEALNRPEVRSTQVAAANMSATARALARHYRVPSGIRGASGAGPIAAYRPSGCPVPTKPCPPPASDPARGGLSAEHREQGPDHVLWPQSEGLRPRWPRRQLRQRRPGGEGGTRLHEDITPHRSDS